MRTGKPQNRDEYVRREGSERFLRLAWRKGLGRLQRCFPSARVRLWCAKRMGVAAPLSASGKPPWLGLEVWLDDTFPELITLGEGSVIALRSSILCHDDASRTVAPVVVGKRAYIGVGAILLPGVVIGDDAVIGAGAVVTHDVPVGETWVGVPARPVSGGSAP